MNSFYTNCRVWGNDILYRGVEDGRAVSGKVPYQPTLFLPSNKQETKHKTLYGQCVEPMKFESIREANNFISRYDDIENFSVYGNTYYHYCYLSDLFPDISLDYDRDKIIIANIDIETESKNGFPDPAIADQIITAITVKIKDEFFVFGCGEFKTPDSKIHYQKCEDEKALLMRFLALWVKAKPDAVSGWNVSGFDLPYLVNRITKLFDEREAKRLSPWGEFTSRSATLMGEVTQQLAISGVSILDYLELYKKYAPNNKQESYKLDHIAFVELGERKLDVDIKTIHETDFQKFITYNIKDVDLVGRLDDKLKLLDLVMTVAYDAKINYEDVLGQVRTWDAIIFNEMRRRNLVVPVKKKAEEKKEKFAGAYVKEPILGFHNWIACFDVASLYPNLIRTLNISPETLEPDKFKTVTVEELLDGKIDTEYLRDENLCLAANGHHFRTDIVGLLPDITTRIYNDRKIYKNKMLEKQKFLEEVKQEIKRRKNG